MLKILTLFILLYSIVACSPSNKPLSSTTTQQEAIDSSSESEAAVEYIQIVIAESFPIRVNVVAKGHLPDSCTFIDSITEDHSGDTFTITILTTQQTDHTCTQGTQTFEEMIPLSVVGLKAGVYAVTVNGITDTFELGVDNVIP